MHWPYEAQRQLVKLFFGEGSTRFDRVRVGVRSNERGIFVRKEKNENGEYLVYEARGMLGYFQGALSRVEAVTDRYNDENFSRSMTVNQVSQLAHTVEGIPDGILSRVSRPASRRWFVSASP